MMIVRVTVPILQWHALQLVLVCVYVHAYTGSVST